MLALIVIAGVAVMASRALFDPCDLRSTSWPSGWPAPAATPVCAYRVVAVYPHDRTAFTQGLVYAEGQLYEGTGLNGQSWLRRARLGTGEVLQQADLPAEHFGEGITLLGDRLFQLTWQSHLGFVYDQNTFQLVQTFNYPTEGWGLTHDGQRLIMSDGTATLYFLDPDTFIEVGRVNVSDERGPVNQLNELEYINGSIYANVWKTDRIARIDPASGRVLAWIDLSGLFSAAELLDPEAVLNGIAYDVQTDRLFVTGKRWPSLFEIELRPR